MSACVSRSNRMVRERITMECTECGMRHYRSQREMRRGNRLELKKYCKKDRKHTVHRERRK